MDYFNDLKSKAEQKLKSNLLSLDSLTEKNIDEFLHDYQVYEIELEMQAEELRESHLDLQHTQQKYADLYDNAPVGYVTLNSRGQILQSNLTFTKMINEEREKIVYLSKFFTLYCYDTVSSDRLYLKLNELYQYGNSLSFEIQLRDSNGKRIDVQMDCSLAIDEEGNNICRATILDISVKKQAQILKE